MRAIMARTGFQGELQAFFTFMRTDARFYYPDSDEGRAAYVAETNALLDEMLARQGELFGHLPKAPVEVRPIEAWREKSAPKAHYRNPPQDRSEEHTSELQSLMRISYAVFCLKKPQKQQH